MKTNKLVIAALIAATAVTGIAGHSAFAKEGADVQGGARLGIGSFLNGFVQDRMDAKHDDDRDDNHDTTSVKADIAAKIENKLGDRDARLFVDAKNHDLFNNLLVVNNMGFAVGRVTAVSGSQVSAVSVFGESGKTLTINTNADTSIATRGGDSLELSSVAVNDLIVVRGSIMALSGNSYTILATSLRDWGPSATIAASGKARVSGSVTSVDATNGTFVVSTKQGGTVTVTADASTTVKNGSTTATGTSALANLAVGAKVRVKGLWNSFLNAVTAVKVRVF